MPHLVCEYSSDHEIKVLRKLLGELHAAAAATGIVRSEDLKIRALAYDDHLFAGKSQPFFCLNFALNMGRTQEQKKLLSTHMLEVLTRNLPNTIHISVDIREMDNTVNSKRVLGER